MNWVWNVLHRLVYLNTRSPANGAVSVVMDTWLAEVSHPRQVFESDFGGTGHDSGWFKCLYFLVSQNLHSHFIAHTCPLRLSCSFCLAFSILMGLLTSPETMNQSKYLLLKVASVMYFHSNDRSDTLSHGATPSESLRELSDMKCLDLESCEHLEMRSGSIETSRASLMAYTA